MPLLLSSKEAEIVREASAQHLGRTDPGSVKGALEQKLYRPVVESSNPDNAANSDKARREFVGKLRHTT